MIIDHHHFNKMSSGSGHLHHSHTTKCELEQTDWDFVSFNELDTLLRVNCCIDEQFVNRVLGNRMTPLCLACKHNREDLVTILLYHGADTNLTSNYFGKSPLHFACDHDRGNIGIVRKLLDANANIDAIVS